MKNARKVKRTRKYDGKNENKKIYNNTNIQAFAVGLLSPVIILRIFIEFLFCLPSNKLGSFSLFPATKSDKLLEWRKLLRCYTEKNEE